MAKLNVILLLVSALVFSSEGTLIRQRRHSSAGSYASSGSYSGAGGFAGGFPGMGMGLGSGPGFPGYFGGFPYHHPNFHNQPNPPYQYDFAALFKQYVQVLQQLQGLAAHMQLTYGGPNFPQPEANEIGSSSGGTPSGGGGAPSGGATNVPVRPSPGLFDRFGGDVGASASAEIEPDGGHGEVNLYDSGTKTGSDGGSFPAPGNGPVSVFTSSSSGSSDINGKKTSYKTATSGTVDATGKVTQYTVNS